jgi:mannose-6-phosphate isomerase-like protein (cupin superfamily)
VSYHVLDPDEVAPLPGRSATTRSLSDAADFDVLGARIYEAAPGEQIPKKYHYHEKQEEVLFVLDGEMHVDTPDGEVVVPAGKAWLVEPGNPHRAHNPDDAEGTVRVFAAGAPASDGGIQYDPGEE